MSNILDFSGQYGPTDYRHPEYELLPYADAANLPWDERAAARLGDGQDFGVWEVAVPNEWDILPVSGPFHLSVFTFEIVFRMPTEGPADQRRLRMIDVPARNLQMFVYPHGFRLYMPGRELLHLTIRDFDPISAHAGKWCCLSFGLDSVAGRAAVVLRGLDGHLLGRRMACATSLQTVFPPATQDALRERVAGCRVGIARTVSRVVRYSPSWREKALEPQRNQNPNVVSDVVPFISLAPMTHQAREVTVGYDQYQFAGETVIEAVRRVEPGEVLEQEFSDLSPGLYTVLVYGRTEAPPEQVWKPMPMRLGGGQWKLLKQGQQLRRMQGFSFHYGGGETVLQLKLADYAQDNLLLHGIQVVDRIAIPLEPMKQSRNLGVGIPPRQLDELTEERAARDERIWHALPELDQHLSLRGMGNLFKVTGPWPYTFSEWRRLRPHEHWKEWDAPLEVVHQVHKTPLERTSGWQPAWGHYFADTKEYWSPLAELMGRKAEVYMNRIGGGRDESHGGMAEQYLNTGDPSVGHDAAVALCRWALDFPAREMSLNDLRYCVMAPDRQYGVDRSHPGLINGKLQYSSWAAADHAKMLRAYDALFPYIQGNQVLVASLQRFLPWVRTAEDVVAFLDTYLVRCGLRDWQRGILRSGVLGELSGLVLGIGERTAPLFDLRLTFATAGPYKDLSYEEVYAVGVNRDGTTWMGSTSEAYGIGAARELTTKADLQQQVANEGGASPTPWHDADRYPKIAAARTLAERLAVCGGFYSYPKGDASGGLHQAARKRKPQASRVLPGVGAAIIELGEGSRPQSYSTVGLNTGVGEGHAHEDVMGLVLFGCGVPLIVPGNQSGGSDWSRPSPRRGQMSVRAISGPDPATAGRVTGEARIRCFHPGTVGEPSIIRAVYETGTERLERDLVIAQTREGEGILLDRQRLSGGTVHTLCLRGPEGDLVADNLDLAPGSHPWTAACRAGSQRRGPVSTHQIVLAWTMAREPAEFPHAREGGGSVLRPAVEQACLGDWWDGNVFPATLRCTVLQRPPGLGLAGDYHSERYEENAACIWLQSEVPEGATSQWLTLWEWYRGHPHVPDKPLQVDWQGDGFIAVLGEWQTQVNIEPERTATITAVDRAGRRLTLDRALGDTLRCEIGREGRWSYWELTRTDGNEYAWQGDTLVAPSGMKPYRDGQGNRQSWQVDASGVHEFGRGDTVRVETVRRYPVAGPVGDPVQPAGRRKVRRLLQEMKQRLRELEGELE